jgi:putative tricarboxylic transport membrane protein
MAGKEIYGLKKRDIIPALIWIIIGLVVMIVSYQMSLGTVHTPGPGMLPFILGSLLVILSLSISIKSLTLFKKTSSGNSEAGIWAEIEFKNILIIVVSLVAYALMLEKIGFLITAFLFLFVLFSVFDSRRWIFALGASLLTVSVTYTLFVLALQVELPSGILRLW